MGHHVFLVEDEPNIVEALRFLFLQGGWQVSAHSDGANAVDVVTNSQPSAIVLDAMLPNKSGFDILKELKAQEGTRDIPVLMLTAKGQNKDREEAIRSGADKFMTKPFSNAEVIKTVTELVECQT